MARHLEDVRAALPASVRTIYARADSGFYCWQAIEAYQTRGCRFVVAGRQTGAPEQYQLFDTPQYSYRVFVTNTDAPIDARMWFYKQRAGAENLIKEANNDAGLAAHPWQRWAMNCKHFQIAMPTCEENLVGAAVCYKV